MPLKLHVSDASQAARDAVMEAGGSVDLVYYDRISLRYTVKPEKFYLKPTFARYAQLLNIWATEKGLFLLYFVSWLALLMQLV